MIRSRFLVAVLLTALTSAVASGETVPEFPETITKATPAGTVEFAHSMHAYDFEIECSTCHHETNAGVLSIPHEAYFDDFWIDCQTCHRPGATPGSPQACSACHHSSPTTIADESLSAKVVIHRSCFGCHEGGTGQEASRSCGLCHQAPEVEEVPGKPERSGNG